MESLAKIVALLEVEKDKAAPALTAAQALWRKQRKRHLTDDIVEEEQARRASVDVACAQFAATLRWPEMDHVAAALALSRIVEAYHFARWLLDSPVQLKKMTVEAWLQWLLVDFWYSMGWSMHRHRWGPIEP